MKLHTRSSRFSDGTLLPLAFRPNQNPEITGRERDMITCDDHLARVRNVVVEWPGCVFARRFSISTVQYNGTGFQETTGL